LSTAPPHRHPARSQQASCGRATPTLTMNPYGHLPRAVKRRIM